MWMGTGAVVLFRHIKHHNCNLCYGNVVRCLSKRTIVFTSWTKSNYYTKPVGHYVIVHHLFISLLKIPYCPMMFWSDLFLQPCEGKSTLNEQIHWADGFVVVYDISDRSSFLTATAIVHLIRETHLGVSKRYRFLSVHTDHKNTLSSWRICECPCISVMWASVIDQILFILKKLV